MWCSGRFSACSKGTEFTDTENTENGESAKSTENAVEISSDDGNANNNPFAHRPGPAVFRVDGQRLNALPQWHCRKLLGKLEKSRRRLKAKHSIAQLHLVLSLPTMQKMAKYAPVELAHLNHFDIAPKRVRQYGLDIADTIQRYLSRHGLVSPFIEAAAGGLRAQSVNALPPPMLRQRTETVDTVDTTDTVPQHEVHCVHCRVLFEADRISRHQIKCAMNPVVQTMEQRRNAIVIDDDSDDAEGIGGHAPLRAVPAESIEIKMDELDRNEDAVLDQTGFLTDSQLEQMPMDVHCDGDGVEMEVEPNGNGDGDGECIETEDNPEMDYFAGIDDAVFTQMPMAMEVEPKGLDTTGFVDDEEMLRCLQSAEQRQRIERELKEKRVRLTGLTVQRERIQREIQALESQLQVV